MGLALQNDRLARRVGAVFLAGAATGVAFLATWSGRGPMKGVPIDLYFAHAGGLEAGSDVQVAGRVIGTVESVRLVPARRSGGAGQPLGGERGVAARVRIDPDSLALTLRNGEYFVAQKGIMGKSYLEMGPPRGAAPSGPLVAGDAIRGIDPPSLERVVAQSYDNLVQTALVLRDISPEAKALVAHGRHLAATWADIEDQARAGKEAMPPIDVLPRIGAIANHGDLIAAADHVGTQAGKTGSLARAAWRQVGPGGRAAAEKWRRLRAIAAGREPGRALAATREQILFAAGRSSEIAATLRGLVAGARRGEGTLGALLFDPEFFDFAKEMSKLLKRAPWRLIAPPPGE